MAIKQDLIKGSAYIAIAKYSGILAQLFISAILARLISPSDFGVVAIATVFICFFNILSDIGIGPAIIQKKDLSLNDLNNIFSLTVYLAIILSLCFFLLSIPISFFYSNEKLKIVCKVLCIPMFFSSLNIVPNGLLFKEKRFKYIATRSLSAQLISGVLAVITALYGAGIYALLANSIISSVIVFFFSYRCSKLHFHLRVEKSSIEKIFSYSTFQFMFNIVNYFSRNLDKLLIGRFIDLTALGYYDKSYRLMMLPLQNLIFVITPVFQPVFSEYQNDIDRLRGYYLKILYLLSWIAFPLTVIVFFCSRELILVFYGNQWEEAVPVFRILSLTICMQILISTTGSIYQSINATKELFISGLCGAIFMTLGFVVSIFLVGTIESVAIGYVFSQVANFIQCFCLLFKKIHYNFVAFCKHLIHPFVISILLAITAFGVSMFSQHLNDLISLMLKALIPTIILVIYLIHIKIINIKSILKYICKR